MLTAVRELFAWIIAWLRRALESSPAPPRKVPRPAIVCEGERVDCLLLDGCNLPLSLKLSETGRRADDRLVARAAGAEEDWIELLTTVVGGAPTLPFARARLIFDRHSATGKMLGDVAYPIARGVHAHATSTNETADDALIRLVKERATGAVVVRRPSAPKAARSALSQQPTGGEWFVVQRAGGGERSHVKLWRKLGLVRTEARSCLLPLSSELKAQASADADQLCGSARFVTVTAMERSGLHTVVATNDVLLARRVVDAGGAVLTWRQLRALCAVGANLE